MNSSGLRTHDLAASITLNEVADVRRSSTCNSVAVAPLTIPSARFETSSRRDNKNPRAWFVRHSLLGVDGIVRSPLDGSLWCLPMRWFRAC